MLRPAAGSVTTGFVLAVPHGVTVLPPERHSDLATLCACEARLWVGDETEVVDLGPHGLAIGALFTRGDAMPCRSVGFDGRTASGVEGAAQKLLDQYWGAYAAVLTSGREARTAILVDPSGLLPVYVVDTASHTLLTSHVRLIARCCDTRLGVDWTELHSFLCRPDLRQRATCVEGVYELRPGSLTVIGAGSCQDKQLWCADAFMPAAIQPPWPELVGELRSTAIAVLGAWEKRLGPIAVAASGGVDSSFICGALHAGGASFGCITAATPDPSGDERAAVRRLANHLDLPYAEGVYDPSQFDVHACASATLPRPSRKSFLNGVDRLFSAAAEELGAAVVMDGNGGDNLFCYLHSAAPVADRLRAGRSPAGWMTTFLDVCRVTGCDVGTMARATSRRLKKAGRFPEWPADARLLARAAQPFADTEPLRPWTDVPVGPHRGKHDHLALIMRAQNHLHGLSSPVPRFSPLMSQPLLELCLSIPTWSWCTGGLNRSLARQAFAGELPPTLRARTAKAGPDSYIRAIFDRNRRTIAQTLLDGVLLRAGLLDRAAVERALTIDAASEGSLVYRLLDLAEAELWARCWKA